MNLIKTISCTIILLALGIASLNAQETVSATGGKATGNAGSVNYTLGQVTYTTNCGDTCSVAMGVQQAYEISIVSAIGDIKEIQLEVSAYPNPTPDILNLTVDKLGSNKLAYQLFDFRGTRIENKPIENKQTCITMRHLATGTYLLQITQQNQTVKTFKIIKR